jgi:hypothetical protein
MAEQTRTRNRAFFANTRIGGPRRRTVTQRGVAGMIAGFVGLTLRLAHGGFS